MRNSELSVWHKCKRAAGVVPCGWFCFGDECELTLMQRHHYQFRIPHSEFRIQITLVYSSTLPVCHLRSVSRRKAVGQATSHWHMPS